jgi:hypothetical protein
VAAAAGAVQIVNLKLLRTHDFTSSLPPSPDLTFRNAAELFAQLLTLIFAPRPEMQTFHEVIFSLPPRHHFSIRSMGVWKGVAMDSLKFYLGPHCIIFPRPAGGPPLKQLYNRLRGGPPSGRAACGRLLPFWTPHAVGLCPSSKILRCSESKL